MHFEGSVDIQASREKVWKFLTDADFVGQCAPGIKSIQVIVPNQKYQAVTAVGFGTVVTEFRTDVEFVELQPLDRAKVKAHGVAQGSAVDAVSEMLLSDGPAGKTTLHWTADIAVVGTIASLAARLMGPVTKKLSNLFFDCVKARLEA